ncbi:MAG: response regulator [Bacteroidetes bacterium]|nr:MAG: response regulator [Bacteroidota bacterium]
MPLSILVAEDNLVNQRLIRRTLQRFGYEILLAENGRQAVDLMRQQPVDLIFMDVQMPEMDGLQATRAIRGLSLPVPPVIVAMTANAMEGDREACLQVGMDDYLAKPFRVHEVEQILRKYGPGLTSKVRPQA